MSQLLKEPSGVSLLNSIEEVVEEPVELVILLIMIIITLKQLNCLGKY